MIVELALRTYDVFLVCTVAFKIHSVVFVRQIGCVYLVAINNIVSWTPWSYFASGGYKKRVY